MSIVNAIKEKLGKYPNVSYEATDNSITVFPLSDNGFEVTLYVFEQKGGEGFTVFYNGWHENFQTSEEALDCFAFGLTSECRLKETSRGGRAYRWTIEFMEDGEWQEGGTTALFFVRFWNRKHERYLQNNLGF